ncbi:MAG: 30S ribosome-binding factor RbfA [Deltaproteobacteria bacterium]|nr:MAG: 30S ribosome-binding factor RbfA [Deltaproteobacteria bacterium]
MKPYTRADRISGRIQVAITDLLRKKMQNPKVEMATITGVKLTSDLRIADVYVAVFGGKKKIAEAMEGFKESKGYIKKYIAPKLGLKFMPELRFFHDDSFDKAAKMDALIQAAADSDAKTPDAKTPDAKATGETEDHPDSSGDI